MLISLIGLPGSGKSTVGKQLARRFDASFFDSDLVIEQQIGCSIREYFEREGEASFRDVEEAVIDDVTRDGVGVLSTGGGVVLRPANRQRLYERTHVVYLRSSPDELFNHNNVKVILNKRGEAIYFSRSPIPYNRNFPEQEWLKYSTYYKHNGIYGYRSEVLKEISALPKTNLEVTESLEQLRWIENGYVIRAEVTSLESIAIDTPEDLLKVKAGV